MKGSIKKLGERKTYRVAWGFPSGDPFHASEHRMVRGYVIGHLAVRNTVDGWVVDHLKSGFKFPWTFRNRTVALCFARDCQEILGDRLDFVRAYSKKAIALKDTVQDIARRWGVIK